LQASPIHAQQTANEALSIALSQMPPGERPPLLGIRIKDSIDGEIWELQFEDKTHVEGRRVLTMKDGKFDSGRPGSIWPFSEGQYAPVLTSQVTQKISDLRRLAHSTALDAAVKPASITYILSRKFGERDSLWSIYFLDAAKVILGVMQVSSLDGLVVQKSFNNR